MKLLHGDAFLFDLDATLVDSSACIENIWRIWSGKYRFEHGRVMEAVHGRTIAETMAKVAPHMNSVSFIAEVQEIAIAELKNVKEVRGAHRFLSSLPPESWAIVTSGPRQVAQASIRNAGLPMPAIMITAEDVARGKPDPEPYLAAAHRLGVSPQRCIVFEDSMAGIESGIGAGATVIALTTTHCAEDLTGLQFLIHDFECIDARISDAGTGARFGVAIDCGEPRK